LNGWQNGNDATDLTKKNFCPTSKIPSSISSYVVTVAVPSQKSANKTQEFHGQTSPNLLVYLFLATVFFAAVLAAALFPATVDSKPLT